MVLLDLSCPNLTNPGTSLFPPVAELPTLTCSKRFEQRLQPCPVTGGKNDAGCRNVEQGHICFPAAHLSFRVFLRIVRLTECLSVPEQFRYSQKDLASSDALHSGG